MLLTLGITLGIIAFSVGSAIACLRATKAAIRERDAAELEAERYRASESMLEQILAAEPQTLLTWTEEDGPHVHVANLPSALGVPSEPKRLLRFEQWLDEESAALLTEAMEALADRGEAFNLMLRTRREKHVEVDGRTAGGMITLKVRDLAGQRLELAGLSEEHRKLDREIAALRALLDTQAKARRPREPRRAPRSMTRFRSFDRLATAFAVFDARPAARPFQPGLCRSVAARRQVAVRAAARRRDPRPAAPVARAAGESRLSRLETELARGLWLQHPEGGSMAPA